MKTNLNRTINNLEDVEIFAQELADNVEIFTEFIDVKSLKWEDGQASADEIEKLSDLMKKCHKICTTTDTVFFIAFMKGVINSPKKSNIPCRKVQTLN